MIVTFTDRQAVSLEEMAQRLDTDLDGVFGKALALLTVSLRETADGKSQIGSHRDGEIKKIITGLRKGQE